MVKINVENEKVKRRYLKYLKEALGYSEATINTFYKAVLEYEDFTKIDDFKRFNSNKATGFKKWLEDKTHRNKPLSIKTRYQYLRHLKSFFIWLSSQSGYKSKIDLDSISYLSLEKKLVRQAIASKPVKFPSLEYVVKLANSIKIKNDIDRRDRALIAFLLLSGMRDKAISTLPLGCFDHENLVINQSPDMGVNTKFGKTIISHIFKFDEELVQYVKEWAIYLEKEKLFGSTDPLFPRSKTEQIEDGYSFNYQDVEPVFWKGTGRIRSILKARSQNAGLDYYHPHSFRHAAVHLALKKAKTAEQMKAISQNFGHEKVLTTLTSYGNLDNDRVREIVSAISFSGDSNAEIDEKVKEFARKIYQEIENNT